MKRHTTPDDEEEDAGPYAPVIGPAIPAHVGPRPSSGNEEDEEEDEDDYTPALPPDLVAARSSQATITTPSTKPKSVTRPILPPSLPQSREGEDEEDDSDDDYGPQPRPAGLVLDENEGVREFLEKEERRRKQIEVGGVVVSISLLASFEPEVFLLVFLLNSPGCSAVISGGLPFGRCFLETAQYLLVFAYHHHGRGPTLLKCL